MAGRPLLLLVFTAALLRESSGMLAGNPLPDPMITEELYDICRAQGVQNPQEVLNFRQHNQCLDSQWAASMRMVRALGPGAAPNDFTRAWCAALRNPINECLLNLVRAFEPCRNASEVADDLVGAWRVALSDFLDYPCDADAGRVSKFYAGDGASCLGSYKTIRSLSRCLEDFGVQSGHDTAVLLRSFTPGSCKVLAIVGDCVAGGFRHCENSGSANVIQGMMDALMAGLPCAKYSLRREPQPLSLSERASLC